jgi:hypothetical protein
MDRAQRGRAHQVEELGPRKARGAARDLHDLGVVRQRDLRRVELEDLAPPLQSQSKRLLIEVRWGSKPLAFAGQLRPRRLSN